MRVSQYDTLINYYAIMGQGLTTDKSGTPWCGWAALMNYTNIYVSHYTDTAWSVPDTIYPFAFFDECDLTTDANGNVWVVANEGYAISACFHNGTSWSELMQVPTQGTCCHNPVATGDTLGNLWVCWHGGGPGDGHHIWGNAYIEGAWGSPVLISYPGSHNESVYSMTTDKQGRVWAGWYRSFCPDHGICVSLNDGGGWSDTMMVAEYTYDSRGPALTVDTAGRVWAGWIGVDSGGPYKVYASYYDGNIWLEPMLVSESATWGDYSVAITSDDEGNVWLTWMNSSEDIYYSYWNGSNWSDPASIDIHPARDYYLKMTFDGERIWVTWIRFAELASSLDVLRASYTQGVGVEEKPVSIPRPSALGLCQYYPNPSRSKTSISYQLRSDCHISIKIYNVVGNLVRALMSKYQKAGSYVVIWDGTDNSGHRLQAGVYFLQLMTSDKSITKKIIEVK